MLLSKVTKSIRYVSANTIKALFSRTNKPKLNVKHITNQIIVSQTLNQPTNQPYSSLIFQSLFKFSKSQSYVEHYNNLRSQINEKKQKIEELKQKVKMLEQMSQTNLSDQLMIMLFSIFGKTYETKAFKQHKQLLIDLRNLLEKRIEESSIKWEEPRKLIMQERQKKIIEFISKIVQYEGRMAQFIAKRQNNNQEHLADINQGLILTHKLLIKNIEKEGGHRICPQNNQNFNENEHQIVSDVGKIHKNNKIESVLLHGWKLKDKILRKARVTVHIRLYDKF